MIGKVGKIATSLTSVGIIGLLIRFALSPFGGNPSDFEAFKATGSWVFVGGFNAFAFWTYGPVSLLMLLSAYPPYLLFAQFGVVDEHILNFFLHLPMNVLDCVAFAAIYKISRDGGMEPAASIKVASLYYLNPLVIWVSAWHGNYDTAMIDLFIVSLSQFRNRPWIAGCLLGVSVGVKFATLLTVPAAWNRLRNESPTKAKAFVFGLLLALVALAVPYIVLLVTSSPDAFSTLLLDRLGFLGRSRDVSFSQATGFSPLTVYGYISRLGAIGFVPNLVLQNSFLSVFLPGYVTITAAFLFAGRKGHLPGTMASVPLYSSLVFSALLPFYLLTVHQFAVWIVGPMILLSTSQGARFRALSWIISISALVSEMTTTSPTMYALYPDRNFALSTTYVIYIRFLGLPNLNITYSVGLFFAMSLLVGAVVLASRILPTWEKFVGRVRDLRKGKPKAEFVVRILKTALPVLVLVAFPSIESLLLVLLAAISVNPRVTRGKDFAPVAFDSLCVVTALYLILEPNLTGNSAMATLFVINLVVMAYSWTVSLMSMLRPSLTKPGDGQAERWA
jgi:hypothetical protein